jgi:copper ion binding protein
MVTIRVIGMTCQHCVAAVTGALSAVEGVADVHVDLDSGTATFREATPVDMDAVRQAVEDAGYQVGEKSG